MATLTNAQRTQVRLMNGDMFAPYLVDDQNLDALFTSASSIRPSNALNYTIYTSILYMIARLEAKECELTEEAREKRLARLDKKKDEWAIKANVYGGQLVTGSIDLDIDADEDNQSQWGEWGYPDGN